MAFRFRRSMQLFPGLRLNFTNKGMSARIGPRGAGYTINSKGEQRVSAGIPGTGLHWSEKIGKKPARQRKAALDRVERRVEPAAQPRADGMERVEPYPWDAPKLIELEPASPNEFDWLEEVPEPSPVAARAPAKATPLQVIGRVVLWTFAAIGAFTVFAFILALWPS